MPGTKIKVCLSSLSQEHSLVNTQLKDDYGGGQWTKSKAMKLLENESLLQVSLAYVETRCSLKKWLREGCSYSVVFLERWAQVLRWPTQSGQVTGRWKRLHGGHSFLQSFWHVCSWGFLLKSSVPFKFIAYLIRPALGCPCFTLSVLSQAPRQPGIILHLKETQTYLGMLCCELPSQPSTTWVRPHTRLAMGSHFSHLALFQVWKVYLRNHYKDSWWNINFDRP